MARIVRCGLIQTSCDWSPKKHSLADIKKKGNVCLACHEQASASRRTEDVLLPAIGLCRTCHMDPGGAQAGCKACHDFHPKRPDAGAQPKESFVEPTLERLSAMVRPFP